MNLKNKIKKIIGITNIKFVKSWFLSSKDKKMIKQRHLFYSQFLPLGSLYFDIGANYGNRIEPLINEDVKIVAVEPQHECIRFLHQKYGKKITILENGVGSKQENKLMYIAPNANILSSFSEDWIKSTQESGRFNQVEWNKTQEIKMITLDYLIATYGKPDFVKIDVEGFELEVLKGLSQDLKVLSLEYTVPECSAALTECLSYLEALSNTTLSFNYCVTENMVFSLPEWVSYNEINRIINSPAFLATKFGDIYVKFNS